MHVQIPVFKKCIRPVFIFVRIFHVCAVCSYISFRWANFFGFSCSSNCTCSRLGGRVSSPMAISGCAEDFSTSAFGGSDNPPPMDGEDKLCGPGRCRRETLEFWSVPIERGKEDLQPGLFGVQDHRERVQSINGGNAGKLNVSVAVKMLLYRSRGRQFRVARMRMRMRIPGQ